MSRQRLFTPPSNGSASVSGSSISKGVHDRKFSGRCFCGQGVTLLQSGMAMNPRRWFVRCPNWKVTRCAPCFDEAEVEVNMFTRLGSFEAEFSKIRFWLLVISMALVCNVVCTVYLIFRRI
ncbi:hypothetical protein S245_028595 [Arachis hypogaea]